MAIAVRKDAIYTIIPKGYGRTNPIEFVISEYAISACFLL